MTTQPKPLHIAIDALGTPTGGGITYIRELLNELEGLRPDWRFTLLYSTPTLARVGSPEVIRREVPGAGGMVKRWWWEQVALPRVLREAEVDVLLCMNGFTCFTTLVPQISLWQNANLVRRTQIRMSRSMATRFWIQRQLQRLSVLKASRNIFLTQHFADLAGSWFPIGLVERFVVHSGINIADLRRADSGKEPSEPLVLSVGHTYFHKNYETLIDAMAVVRERDPELRLLILGAPEDLSYHEELRARIQRRGLADRVELAGAAGPDVVADAYARARIYVTTSLLESFGLTPLEAMAHDVPALVPDESCFPEVCGDAALYCDPRDPADVATKILRLSSDGVLRETFRRRGRKQLELFSWRLCAEGVLGHIEQVANHFAGSEPSHP